MRRALVTGVSRRRGIGAAVVRRLLTDGASVLAHGWSPYDATEPWGADPVDALRTDLGGPGPRLVTTQADLADPAVPRQLVDAGVEAFGALDTLVANHAPARPVPSASSTPTSSTSPWRSTSVRRCCWSRRSPRSARPRGRPHRAVHVRAAPWTDAFGDPVRDDGALQQITATLADALAGRGVTVNCLNPGPPTRAGHWRTPTPPSPAPCRAVGGTPRTRPRASWPSGSPTTPRRSPARGSTPAGRSRS